MASLHSPRGRERLMMMRLWIVAVATLGLGGCISAAIDEKRAEQTCLAYGAKPGTAAYVNCRVTLGQQYAAQTAQARRGLLAAGGAMMMGGYRPSYCTGHVGAGGIIHSYC